MLLDLGLPDLDGTELLKMIRAVSKVPVIVITARSDDAEVVRTLDSGADDYLVKPFTHGATGGPGASRAAPHGEAPEREAVRVGGLEIDPPARRAALDGAALDLSPKEFDLLLYLARRAGEVVTKREMLAEVWREPYGGSERTVDVHLSWLRRKMGETRRRPPLPADRVRRRHPSGRPLLVRRRLSLLVLAVTSMVVAAFVVPLGVLVKQQTESRALARGERTAQAVAAGLAVAASLSPDLPAEPGRPGGGHLRRRRHLGVPPRRHGGRPRRRRRSAAVEQARTGRALSADAARRRGGAGPGDRSLRGPRGADLGAGERTPHEGVAAAWAVLGGLGLLLILAGVALADRMGAALVRPVAALAGAARRMAGGDLEARVEPAGPPEIADAGAAFNHLAGRLDDLVAAERESLADLSHRLRTPLTALRLQAESLPGARPSSKTWTASAPRWTPSSPRPAAAPPPPGPAAPTCAGWPPAAAAFWQVLAEEQGRRARLAVPAGPIWVALTEDELGAAVDTLLENVFTHTPPGTAYAVAVTAADPGHALLVVEDEGPGFPHHGVAERGASEAGSSGLGLDIARRAARHTGGDLTLADRPGGGARVEVRFGRT